MNTPQSNEVVSTRQGLAYIILACGVMFPSMSYFCFESLLFGEHPLLKVLCISGVAGTLSGALIAGRRKWLAGGIGGLVGGAGSSGALALYAWCLHREHLWKAEGVLVLVLGALPGALLALYLARLGSNDSRPDDAA